VARLPALLESLLFAAGAPVPVARLVEALGGPSRAEVVRALEELARSYERDERGLRLVQVAGGYQLRTPAEHGPWVRRLLRERPPRLSRPMLETLAIVAYRQPCTRLDIEAVRGVDADAVLSTLLERRLIRIAGRKETPGRPLLYTTTRDFLEVFGLPDLGALPPLRDLGDGAALLAAKDLTVGGEGVAVTLESPAPPRDEGE
jgi:segregation and condensation protein B